MTQDVREVYFCYQVDDDNGSITISVTEDKSRSERGHKQKIEDRRYFCSNKTIKELMTELEDAIVENAGQDRRSNISLIKDDAESANISYMQGTTNFLYPKTSEKQKEDEMVHQANQERYQKVHAVYDSFVQEQGQLEKIVTD